MEQGFLHAPDSGSWTRGDTGVPAASFPMWCQAPLTLAHRGSCHPAPPMSDCDWPPSALEAGQGDLRPQHKWSHPTQSQGAKSTLPPLSPRGDTVPSRLAAWLLRTTKSWLWHLDQATPPHVLGGAPALQGGGAILRELGLVRVPPWGPGTEQHSHAQAARDQEVQLLGQRDLFPGSPAPLASA